jgi:hypothetical protein
MEGSMNFSARTPIAILLLGVFMVASMRNDAQGQRSVGSEPALPAELELRKTAKTRFYEGKAVEGEERVIRSGETLWEILIQEKGLSEKRFASYHGLIARLNPHVKRLDDLPVGETVFIPFRPDEMLGVEVAGHDEIRVYRVKAGDGVYKILRREFGIEENEQLQAAFQAVQDLNPSKKNWDLLIVGELLRLPGRAQGTAPGAQREAAELAAATVSSGEESQALAAADWQLLEQVAQALRITALRAGQEVFLLQEGAIMVDRTMFPVFSDATLGRKVVMDPQGTMPPALRARIEAEDSDASVLAIKKGSSVSEIATDLLARLGYQALAPNRPLVLRDADVGIQVKGDWMVMLPETTGQREQFRVFVLSETLEKIPEHLEKYLVSKGVKLALVSPPASAQKSSSTPEPQNTRALANGTAERLSGDKGALVDSVLRACQIPFTRDQEYSAAVHEGIRLKVRVDRYLEVGGRKLGLLFGALSAGMKQTVERNSDLKLIDMDMNRLSGRDIIARTLAEMGESVAYAEHRFPAIDNGRLKDSVVLTLRGFLLDRCSLLFTDRAVPAEVERVLTERGLRVAYFR